MLALFLFTLLCTLLFCCLGLWCPSAEGETIDIKCTHCSFCLCLLLTLVSCYLSYPRPVSMLLHFFAFTSSCAYILLSTPWQVLHGVTTRAKILANHFTLFCSEKSVIYLLTFVHPTPLFDFCYVIVSVLKTPVPQEIVLKRELPSTPRSLLLGTVLQLLLIGQMEKRSKVKDTWMRLFRVGLPLGKMFGRNTSIVLVILCHLLLTHNCCCAYCH